MLGGHDVFGTRREEALEHRREALAILLVEWFVEFDERYATGLEGLLREGFRDLRPDIVGFQEAIVTDAYDQPRDLLGPDFHFAHQRLREPDGSYVSIASRWPIADVRELDGRTSARARRHPFNCGTLAAEIEIPEPLGRLLFVNHIPSWQQGFELEHEAQTVAAAQLVEQMRDGRPAHVVLAGDLDAEPDSASIRFLSGLQSLHGTSVVYRDAWSSTHPGEDGHTFSPQNPMVTTGETGAYALEPGRRIDYIFVACSDHGPTLDIRDCHRLFDEPVDGVWASDHFGVTATLSTAMADGRPVP
jgi:endonuclease/exonuclease/phosphatase family metal-dependent hydrolase